MKRTSTAAWSEKRKLWRIDVQKDGERRSFYSSKPGRTGQREANAKADAWLEDGVHAAEKTTVEQAWNLFLSDRQGLTGTSSRKKEEYFENPTSSPLSAKRRSAASRSCRFRGSSTTPSPKAD